MRARAGASVRATRSAGCKPAQLAGARSRVGARLVQASAALVAGLLWTAPLEAQVALEGEAETGPERHQVVEGDTLSGLAERHLGSDTAWPKLWSYNPEITNPHWIYPGHVLRLQEGVALEAANAAGVVAISTRTATRGTISLLGPGRRQGAGSGVVLIGEEVYLDREALAQAARIVGSKEEHLMLSPTDEVYLKYKEGSAPAEGKELTVFLRQHRAEVSPNADKLRVYASSDGGEIVRVIGALRVVRFDAKKRIARAVVVEALDPIERGFEVADVPRALSQVAPKTNARNVTAKIVAATRPLGTLGEGQLVFVDAGAKQGVEVGNRFWVIRRGDPWRQQLMVREELSGAERPERAPLSDDAFPPEVVAELRVLYVRPESATALISASRTDIGPGDRVELRAGY